VIEDILEGKYFAFNFYADCTEETSALAIFQVRKSALEEAWRPCDHYCEFMLDPSGDHTASEAARRYLKRKKVKEVYTLGDGRFKPISEPEVFLGYTLHWNDENGWGHYDALDPHFWSAFFREAGIELKFFKKY